MGAVLEFLENPFIHFLNSRKTTTTMSSTHKNLTSPPHPFSQVGATQALMAADAMEIPLVIVYCTSILLTSGHTADLQKYPFFLFLLLFCDSACRYLPNTFLFTRSPISEWFTLQDTVESLLPTTSTHHATSPTVITTTTTRPLCDNGKDFMWHLRFMRDFDATDIPYREAAYSWKRVYAESRVHSFLLAGLDRLDEVFTSRHIIFHIHVFILFIHSISSWNWCNGGGI